MRLPSREWETGTREEQAGVHLGWARGGPQEEDASSGAQQPRLPDLGWVLSPLDRIQLCMRPALLGVSAGRTWSLRDRGPERRTGLFG